MTLPAPRMLLLALTATVLVAGCGREMGDLEVRVIDARSGAPVAGAEVTVGHRAGVTGPQGNARFRVPTAQYPLEVRHRSFHGLSSTVFVGAGYPSSKAVALQPRPEAPASPSPEPSAGPGPQPSPGASPQPRPSASPKAKASVFGTVKDLWGKPIAGATVVVESNMGVPFGMATTDGKGAYQLGDLPALEEVQVTVIADGYESRTRSVRPAGATQVHFSGGFGLRPGGPGPTPTHAPDSPETTRISGQVEDTQGRALDGVVIKAESHNVRYPFNETAIARNGRFEMRVPVGLKLRFTATKSAHRTVTFTETVAPNQRHVHFIDARALDPVPVLEGESAE